MSQVSETTTAPAASKDLVGQIKIWIFPTIVTILGTLIWNSTQSLQSDVKLLLMRDSADQVRISQLEAKVAFLEQYVIGQPPTPKQTSTVSQFVLGPKP